LLGCGGPIPSKPTINSFTAAPPTIAPGDSSVLSWNVTGATSVTISHGIGSVSSTGTRSTSPATTTNYLLTATNSSGSVYATATVTIAPKPTINSFKATPPTIASGGSSTLSWNVTGATSVTIDQGIGSVSSIDARSVRPTRTTTYTLTATNSVGSVTATAIITIAPKPTINFFNVTPEVVDSGGNSTLSWDVTNATSVKIEPGIGSVEIIAGVRTVIPITTTTYTLTATNSVGSVTAKVKIRVNEIKIIQPGPIDGQDVDVCRYLPDTSMSGDSSVLFVGRAWWVSPLDVNRTYIKFNLSSIPTGAVIIEAKLKLYQDNYTGESGYPNMEIFLWRAEGGWNENTITWNNQPPTSRVALGGSWIIDHVSNQWRERDITVLVSGWFRGTYPNYGLMLSAKNEFTIKALAMFCSSNNTDALKRPKLEIKYYIP